MEATMALSAPPAFTLDGNDLRALTRLNWTVETVRRVAPNMPLGYLHMLLWVSMKPGLGPTEYAKLTGTTQPIASRVLLEIGPQARERQEPLNLVSRCVSPHSLRQVEYRLTPKGEALVRRVTEIMRPENLR